MAERTQRRQVAKDIASKPLSRGKACGNCRDHKSRCDAAKPKCGPCMYREKPCVYADGPMGAKIKALMAENAGLKAEITILKNSSQYTSSVPLHLPYSFQTQDSHPTIAERIVVNGHAMSSDSPSSTLSNLPSGMNRNVVHATGSVTQDPGSSSFVESVGHSETPGSPAPSSSAPWEEPQYHVVQRLVDTFLLHATQFGFALNPVSFRESALLPLPLGDSQRPTPALMTVVLLWGTRLLRNPPPGISEPQLLKQALGHISNDLNGDHPRRMVHTLQAHILLGYYFLAMGNFLQAELHSQDAVHITRRCGFHRIRSSNMPSTPGPSLGLIQDRLVALDYPANHQEEGERINAFWHCVNLHKIVTVTTQPSDQLCGVLESYSTLIDTPWPEDVESYQKDDVTPPTLGCQTLVNFLRNTPGSIPTSTSLTGLLAQSTFLLHRAAYVATRYTPVSTHENQQSYSVAWGAVNSLINTIRSHLPSIPDGADDSTIRLVILIHSLLAAAAIKLHAPFAHNSIASKQASLEAAQEIIRLGQMAPQDLAAFNPVIGHLWMTACLVLIDELSHTRRTPELMLDNQQEHTLEEWYRYGVQTLTAYAVDGPFMRYNLLQTTEAFNAI